MLKLLIFKDKYSSAHNEFELLIIIILKNFSLLSAKQLKGRSQGSGLFMTAVLLERTVCMEKKKKKTTLGLDPLPSPVKGKLNQVEYPH